MGDVQRTTAIMNNLLPQTRREPVEVHDSKGKDIYYWTQ
jgi:hypothetical protein